MVKNPCSREGVSRCVNLKQNYRGKEEVKRQLREVLVKIRTMNAHRRWEKESLSSKIGWLKFFSKNCKMQKWKNLKLIK